MKQRVVLDLNCPMIPSALVGTLGWLETTPQYHVLWLDSLKYGVYSRRVSMGDQQIKNYVRVIGVGNE
jgi:hypothetical protein